MTITLKHYMWSDGQPVTASNVMFWMNMETAEPANYGGYTGFPASIVKNVKVVSPTELTMTMDKAYSQSWFLYNELSQITPMPEAWDRTASGPSHCTTTVSDCKAVYTYLDGQSKTLNSYASSPIWSVVDGPWKLSAFNADGHITFVPNKSYSGPVKATLSQFKEVPFTTDSAEYSVLQAPNSSVTVGYLPEQDAPAKPVDQTVGTNPLHGYTLSPLYSWGINYYVTNFQSTTGNAPDHQAAVLPAGAGLPDEPEVGDPGSAARLWPVHYRPGAEHPEDAVPVAPEPDGRSVPVQRVEGQEPADQPRLDGHPERDDHLHQPELVRRGDQEGPGAELHLPVLERDRLDHLGDDPAAVQRGRGRASS